MDDEEVPVTVKFGRADYTVAEGGTVDVTVTLNRDPKRTVTIPIERTNRDGAGGPDYSGVPSSVTFDSGDTSVTIHLHRDAGQRRRRRGVGEVELRRAARRRHGGHAQRIDDLDHG